MATTFKPIERTVKAMIESIYPESVGLIGGDLSYTGPDEFYILVSQVPGSGSSDELEGSWAVDIEVFATSWREATERSLQLEALLISTKGFSHDGQRIDRVYANTSPSDLPWDAESVFRVGATYGLTARRSG